MDHIESLKYPIGKFQKPASLSQNDRIELIKSIRKLPKRLTKAVEYLSDEQLNTPYRPGGWTVAQVVHHLPDSHVNSYIRFKWALTEDTPMIKAYDENLWSETPDATSTDISASLQLLKGLHKRWTRVLTNMSERDYARELSHPEWSNNLSLDTMLALYAWHCDHHLAHVRELIKRKGW
jgi:uncharacterized damage-inducible protein DinB